MKSRTRTWITNVLGLLLCFTAITTASSNDSPTNTVRALFIGNSYCYADDIPWICSRLSNPNGAGVELKVQAIAFAGATLQSHWEKGEAVKQLNLFKFDYVVLQEQSMRPLVEPDAFRKYAKLFDQEIKSSGAKAILFLTWPRKQYPENLSTLKSVYFGLAMEINATIAPVGIVWNSVLNDNPSIRLYHEDGSHPSPYGSYLAACVLHAVLLDKSPVGLPRTFYTVAGNGNHVKLGELDRVTAKLIQNTAWQCVKDSKQFNTSASR